jgi:2-C-methyl-D-erythritol 2,4-cyclodiphosphate synthase
MLKDKGHLVTNIDSTIFAQNPKMSPFKNEMRENIAHAVETEAENVNIKATTTEGLGMIGEGDGIGAMCVVLID